MSNKYPGGIITSGANAGYSVAFDGNGDSLTAPQSNSFRFSGNFTIEAWVYANSSAGGSNYDGVFDTRSGNVVSSASAGINYTPSGYLNAYVAGSNLTSSTLLGANRWVHVALVRSGSAVTLYQNGISVATGTTSANLTDGYCTVGGFVANGYWNGYISNVRVVNGTAVYSGSSTTTANFALPTQLFPITNTSFLTCQSPAIVDNSVNAATITANGNAAVSTFTPFTGYTAYNPALGAATPGIWTVSDAIQAAQTRRWNMYDPYFNLTTLLLHGNYTGSVNSSGTAVYQNNNFLDSSSNNFTITRNGNPTQGTFSPFSQTGWSSYFSSSSFTTNTALFNSGWGTSGASSLTATIDGWVYVNALGTTPANVWWNPNVFAKGDNYMCLGVNSSGNIFFYHYDGTARTITSSNTISTNTWVYVAVTITGGTATLYINGTSVGSGTWYGIQSAGLTGAVTLGRSPNPSGQYWNGYISNFRVSSVARTISTPTAAFTSDGNTSFLTFQSNRFIDTSSNAYALTVENGTPSVQAFSPFYPLVAYTPQAQGGSGYFDGTTDYLVASGAALDTGAGTSDVTFECWVYNNGYSGSQYGRGIFTFYKSTDYNNNRLMFRLDSASNKINCFLVVGGSLLFGVSGTNSTASATPSAWTHLALVRSSQTFKLYINGALDTTLPATTASLSGFDKFDIGRTQDGTVPEFNGNMAGFRYLKGTAQYTAAFTPPTAPPTAITNTQLLLNYTNAGIIDSTANNVLETVGNAQISTAQSKFGGSSMYFDGTEDYLYEPSNQSLTFGTGDFTVEMWVYPVSLTSTISFLFATRPATTNGAYPVLYADNTGTYWYVSSANKISGSVLSTNTWTHLAVCRSGSSTKMFINGTQTGSTYADTTNYLMSRLYIGASDYNSGTSEYLNGYIDDLRVTKGYARYTANFTPQTSQWQDQ